MRTYIHTHTYIQTHTHSPLGLPCHPPLVGLPLPLLSLTPLKRFTCFYRLQRVVYVRAALLVLHALLDISVYYPLYCMYYVYYMYMGYMGYVDYVVSIVYMVLVRIAMGI